MPELLAPSQLPAVWLTGEAHERGESDRSIARHVAGGDWHRIRRGAFCSGIEWAGLTPEQRHGVLTVAGVKQAQTDVVVSHLSALPFYRAPMWHLPLDTVHLTRPDQHAGRKERGIQQHVGALTDQDLLAVEGLCLTSAARTGLDVTMQAPLDAAVVVLDHLVNHGFTTPDLLRERYATMENWPGSLRSDLALRLMDGRAESIGETLTRLLCWHQRLPTPIPQVPVLDASGRELARVDLAWPAYGVFLEFDGKVKYERLLRAGESASDAVIREKRREQLIVELTGWRVIRLVWAELLRPEATARRIRRLLFPPGRVA